MSLHGKPSSKHSVESIFHDVQFSKSSHHPNKKLLTQIYKESDFKDFFNKFLLCLKQCLMHEEKSDNVERTLDFAAEFAVSFSLGLNEDATCPLLEGTFQFIFDSHECTSQLIRLRICQLMNRLLDNMGHDATVLEETYDKIAENMLIRLQDSMSSVRTQAVCALHRLQSPNDPKCDIIQAFMYHMSHDPSHDVRRTIVQKIAVNKMTLSSILFRMNDTKDVVRKEAYSVISRFLIRQFTIKQRQLILECGLGDRSEVARNFVINVLVPNWLKHFNNNYYEFLECIHAGKIPQTCLKLLKSLFAKQHKLMLESSLKDMWIINKKISYDRLNTITVMYWRAMAEYVRPTDDNDEFENIFLQLLPDLTPFCKYIRGYYFPPDSKNEPNSSDSKPPELGGHQNENETPQNNSPRQPSSSSTSPETNKQNLPNDQRETKKGAHVPDEAVLLHLLEICKVYDLSDEMGRSSLQQLCIDLLQCERVTLQSVVVLTNLLDHTIPCVDTKLTVMAEIITELREPLLASDNSVYVPDLLLIEAEDKKTELTEKIAELTTEMEIAKELGDGERIEEIKVMNATLIEELRIMNTVTPHEPGRNVNNNPNVLKKCLTIVVEIMRTGKITTMNPTLYSLMQNFILPTLNFKIDGKEEAGVKNLALQALNTLCVLDGELAREHFFLFCLNIAYENLSVTALKCVLDLLLVYGLPYFNIETPEEGVANEESSPEIAEHKNLIVLLMSLLKSEFDEMKKTAVTGLGKLLFAGRVKSPSLVSKLILLWYDPDVESDPHVRQALGVFFRMFATSCPHAPQLLLKAFIPTIKTLFALEVSDPLAEIDVENVANLIVDLTRPKINKNDSKDQSIHNQLAIRICEEILTEQYEAVNSIVFLKILNHLELNYDLTTDIAIITALASRIVKSISKGDKINQRLAMKFKLTLQVQQDKNKTVSTVNNTLPAEVSVQSAISSRASEILLSGRFYSGSDKEDSEDEEPSEDETVSRVLEADSDGGVIEGSPESFNNNGSDVDSREYDPPAVKSARISQDSDFKYPTALPPMTPAKQTPFKVPAVTPKRSEGKTPAKKSSLTLKSNNTDLVLENTLTKKVDLSTAVTPSKTPRKKSNPQKETPVKTPAKCAKTPAKCKVVSLETPLKTPAKCARTPAKSKVVSLETPANTLNEDNPASDRITRSSRKRKS